VRRASGEDPAVSRRAREAQAGSCRDPDSPLRTRLHRCGDRENAGQVQGCHCRHSLPVACTPEETPAPINGEGIMNRHEENIDKAFESLLPSAQPQQVQDAAARVLQQLRSAREGAAEAVVPKRTPARRNWRFLAAAVVVLAVLGSAVMVREFYTPRSAFVETAGGGLYRIVGKNAKALPVGHVVEYGEVLRAGVGASAVLALADGSRVEMREQTELSLEPAADGVRIRLNKGGVIVNAAKQRAGHLYVQTRE